MQMKRFVPVLLAACTAVLMFGCKDMKVKILPYPEAPRSEVVDDYFGTQVPDPYRWLEDSGNEETRRWVVAENRITADYLARIPYRDALKQRLVELWNYPKCGLPYKAGDYYFLFRNDGLQNQSVLYRQSGLDSLPEVFLDPNLLSEDGTAALSSISFSDNGRYMAYAVARSGSDWVEIRVMETATGRRLNDLVRWVKFSGASWSADSRGFYYSRYDAPTEGETYSAQNRGQKVYYHAIGTPQSSDIPIYQDKYNPLRYFSATQSDDGRYLFIYGSEGTHGTEVLYRSMSEPGDGFRTLFKGFDHDYSIVFCEDHKAWVLTNEGAPNYRLVKIDLRNPAAGFEEVIPEGDCLLERVNAVGGYLLATRLENAVSAVTQYDMDGKLVRTVELETLGTVSGFSGKKESTETFYALSNFVSPATLYRYDLATGESALFDRPEVAYDPEDYVTEQLFFESRDGTRVPMFVVHKKKIRLDGKNPLYLYGYGGFNISLTPEFNPAAILFMEQGGVYVEVNLRGGGEYGEEWHRAGMLENKQNVFDDFIAAAEYLIEKGYTSPEKLAIAGGSNGGLLVGACMVQRPDLFAVALPSVGVLDMLRYHRFTIGWGWSVEYGNSDNEEQFRYLYAYSPLHNVRPGVCYPATLITTGDHDDRVVPAHSYKFAATLQAVQDCEAPVLIRIETDAGHGAGKPTSKRIDETADRFAFLFWNTHSTVKF